MTRLLLAALLLPAVAAAGEPQVAVHRFALVVGSNDGGPERVRLQYAETDARAIADLLTQLGGVAREDVHLLFEPGPLQMELALEDMAARIDAAGVAGRTELIVYFSGHSDEEGLLLGGERFAYRDLRAALNELPVDVRVGILDSCASGALTRTKGGKMRPPFLLDESTDVSGHAFLTSSSATEAAQESDAIGASFFTHYLISGLRGAADTTGDGRVTLNEAYQFAFGETLARTEKTRNGAQHPSYDIQLAGTGDLVLTDLRVTDAGLVLEEPLDGRLYVHDADDRLVAELTKAPGRRVEIGLEAGAYRLTLRQEGLVFETRVAIERGARARVAADRFAPIDTEEAVARGEVGALEAAYRHQPVVVTLVPRLRPPEPVRADLSVGLISSAVTELDGFAFAALANATTADARGFLLALGFNSVGGDLEGFALSVGGNVVDGSADGLAWATGFNITGGRHRLGQLAVGFNMAGGDVYGAQGSVGFNLADSVTGAQAAVGFNIADGAVAGPQVSAGFNIANGGVTGAQVSTGFNIARGDVHGVQASVGFNRAGDVTGAQVSAINVAKRVRGVQIGLINVAEEVDGIPIGLINWVENGQRHVAYWASPHELVNLELRFGSRHFYTVVMGGFRSPEEDDRWYAALGLGGTVDMDPFFLNLDISGGPSRRGFNFDPVRGVRTQARVFLAWHPFERLGVFAGGSFNAFGGWDGEDIVIERAPQAVRSNPDSVWRFWPSFFAGIQI